MLLCRPIVHNLLPPEIPGGDHRKSMPSFINQTFIKCLHDTGLWHLVGEEGHGDEENMTFSLRELAVYYKDTDVSK